MSYAFTVSAPTKAAAKAAVHDKFNDIVTAQPIHAYDEKSVVANANDVIDLLEGDETRHITVSCRGAIVRRDVDAPIHGVSISASASWFTPTV
jgi:hypothetical protein